MALQKSYTDNSGTTHEKAYTVVQVEDIKKEEGIYKAHIRANIYSCEENKDKAWVGFIEFDFNYNLEGDNIITQAYNYLKTLEEYSEAVDV